MITNNFKGGVVAIGGIVLFIFLVGLLSRYLSSIKEKYRRKQYFDNAFMTDTFPYISRI